MLIYNTGDGVIGILYERGFEQFPVELAQSGKLLRSNIATPYVLMATMLTITQRMFIRNPTLIICVVVIPEAS